MLLQLERQNRNGRKAKAPMVLDTVAGGILRPALVLRLGRIIALLPWSRSGAAGECH
jgi:hypothetical protein